MDNSLYFIKDFAGFSCSRIASRKYAKQYASMDKKINLKKDLKWHETRDLQMFIRKAAFWKAFPSIGLTLVGAEFKKNWKTQSIDLLFLQQDGVILPCELKIGGKSKDAHGQLIRYIAFLYYEYYQNPLSLLNESHSKFLKWLNYPFAKNLHKDKYNKFISVNEIDEKSIRLLKRSGLLMDEEFQPSLLNAVRYLNEECDFSIRMIQIKAYVQENWSLNDTPNLFRVDFVDVQ